MKNIIALKKSISIFLIFPLLFGCSHIMLIGAYNQNVDNAIQQISQDVSTLFVTIEKNIEDNKDFSYPIFRNDYIKIESEITSCKIVASGIPKYNIIIQQINLLDSSVHILEADHKTGFFNTSNTHLTTAQKISAVEVDRSGIANALQNMLTLQEGLKREK